jgi:hypothetical protein
VFQARPQEQMKKKAFHAQRRVLFVFFTDEFPSFEKEASHKSLDFLHQKWFFDAFSARKTQLDHP